MREESYSVPAAPAHGASPFEGGAAGAVPSAAQQSALLLALSTSPRRIAAGENMRSRECEL